MEYDRKGEEWRRDSQEIVGKGGGGAWGREKQPGEIVGKGEGGVGCQSVRDAIKNVKGIREGGINLSERERGGGES